MAKKLELRPQYFREVVGQDKVVTTLTNAITTDRVALAYLFSGPHGVGKTTLARLLAKALNCTQREGSEPCGICPSCHEIAAGCSCDVIEIDGASHRGIDDIRSLNETVRYATPGRCKVYIIDEVHMLTKEAFNALLKTLEEPPAHVHFVFATTEPHKVPPTILSRLQRFDLSRLADTDIAKKLAKIAQSEKIAIDAEALQLIAYLSDGALRDAEHLLEQLVCSAPPPITRTSVEAAYGLLPRDDFFQLDEAALTSDLSFAFTLAEKLYLSGSDMAHSIDMLADHYRWMLLIHLFQKSPPVDADRYKQNAGRFTTEQLITIYELIFFHREKLLKSSFKRLHLELLFEQIIRSMKQIRIDAIAKKLLEMQAAPTTPFVPKTEKSDIELDNLVRFAGVALGGTLK